MGERPQNILGTYDLEKKVEDTVIILETTQKNYGDPNRAVIIEEAILQLIESKVSVHSADRYALLSFGEKTETLLNFDDWSLDEFKRRLYDNINILGTRAYALDAVMVGFQVLASSMMKLFEGKQFRMIIITEGAVDNRNEQSDWRELVDKCEKVGVFIDVVEITSTPHKNYLKSIAAGTKGDYIVTSLNDATAYMSSLAQRKKIVSVNQSEADKNMTAFLDIIAQPLLRLDAKIKTPKDLKQFITATDDRSKCAICHSDSCMICRGPSFACGASCPNCGRFFHEHCFAAWAESQKDSPPNIGKCPICFALLKVPGAMFRVKVLQGHMKGRFAPPTEKYKAEKIKAKELGIVGAQIECPWCQKAFNPEEDVLKCGNPMCNAYYHVKCFDAMIKKTGDRCRVCDSIQARRLDTNPALMRIT